MRLIHATTALLVLAAPAPSPAPAADPPPVPLTRPEMKQLLEESKKFEPRLKGPAPTPEEVAAAKERGIAPGSRNGGANFRSLLPRELRGGAYFFWDGRTQQMDQIALRDPKVPPRTETTRPNANANPNPDRVRLEPDPNMTLDYAFKTMLFWIVSRSNNCIYCMGHQEAQLPAFGVSEDRIAALDVDWSEFTLAERAAFSLARKMTVAPQTVTDADIEALRQHFKEIQVLEIVGIVAGFNAMNRYTGPVRLTQQDFRLYLTPTSPKYASKTTLVGPAPSDPKGTRCMPAAAPRPPLESRSAVEAKWAECQTRKPRFALMDESSTRAILPAGTYPDDAPLPIWTRLLAHFPKAGPDKITTLRKSETLGTIPARLNAQLAWVSARSDGAWYALAYARDRLRTLGENDDTIFAIDQASSPRFSPAECAAFAFAKKLTVDPALIDDSDFVGLHKFYSDAEIAELIYHVNHDVFFNRVTETASLPLEGGSNNAAVRSAQGGR